MREMEDYTMAICADPSRKKGVVPGAKSARYSMVCSVYCVYIVCMYSVYVLCVLCLCSVYMKCVRVVCMCSVYCVHACLALDGFQKTSSGMHFTL